MTPSTRVLVASSAMLAFISFWRVAAIVLNDMGSSAFYAGAISEHFVGKTAPWFVLAIMLLAGTVAALYIESCGMFVRGGFRVIDYHTQSIDVPVAFFKKLAETERSSDGKPAFKVLVEVDEDRDIQTFRM